MVSELELVSLAVVDAVEVGRLEQASRLRALVSFGLC